MPKHLTATPVLNHVLCHILVFKYFHLTSFVEMGVEVFVEMGVEMGVERLKIVVSINAFTRGHVFC
jgi:hypothetical protein